MAENPLLKSLSSFMRRPYSKEFITILKKKTCEYPLKCSGFVIMLAENQTLWRGKRLLCDPTGVGGTLSAESPTGSLFGRHPRLSMVRLLRG